MTAALRWAEILRLRDGTIADRLLGLLERHGPMTVHQACELIGGDVRTSAVHRELTRLVAHRAVEQGWAPRRPGNPGRRPYLYTLKEPPA